MSAYVVTYSKRLLTFLCETKTEAEKVLAACFENQGGMLPEGDLEADPAIYSLGEYLKAVDSPLDDIVFDDKSVIL